MAQRQLIVDDEDPTSMELLANQLLTMAKEIRSRPKPVPAKIEPIKGGKLLPRRKITICEPYVATKASPLVLKNLEIDCQLVKRAIELFDGAHVTVENCSFLNATSVIEKDVRDVVIEFTDVDCGITERYAIYVDSRGLTNERSNIVRLKRCTFLSSREETPLRFMPCTAVSLIKVSAIDTIDVGGNKAFQGVRFHCYSVYAEDCVFAYWTRLGPESDGKNHPDDVTMLAEFFRCNFEGGIRIGRGTRTVRITACELDGNAGGEGVLNGKKVPAGETGWALNKDYNGVTKDCPLDLRVTDSKLWGQVETKLGKFPGSQIYDRKAA